MKVLFLDLDGVLNSFKTCDAQGGFPQSLNEEDRHKWDWACVQRIKEIINKTGCFVVLSSFWRTLYPVLEISTFFGFPILDATPVHRDYGSIRGDEIKEWLENNPEVTKYAIVDDSSDMLEEQSPYFVNTSLEDGLTSEDTEALISILNS